MCHMYLEHCINNNPKQQEGRLNFLQGIPWKVGKLPAKHRHRVLRLWGAAGGVCVQEGPGTVWAGTSSVHRTSLPELGLKRASP